MSFVLSSEEEQEKVVLFYMTSGAAVFMFASWFYRQFNNVDNSILYTLAMILACFTIIYIFVMIPIKTITIYKKSLHGAFVTNRLEN